MGSMFHKSDVLGSGVYTLSILYGSLKHIGEFSFVSKKIGPDKVDHAPVFDKIVL